MPTKVQKWGNSLAVRLPREITRGLDLRAGNDVEVRHDRGGIFIKRLDRNGKRARKDDWNIFLIPGKRKKEHVSDRIDQILYEASR